MSKFSKVVRKTPVPNKSETLDSITQIYSNLEYLRNLFWSTGGGQHVATANRFDIYKKDIERSLDKLHAYVETH